MTKKRDTGITLDAGLNARQNAFVFWYTTPGDTFYNATRAAERAGYTCRGNALARVGSDNIRKPRVSAAIRARQREIFSAADISVDKVLADIEMVRQLAIRDGNHLAALRASELHGKHLKMFADKIEHLHTVDNVSTDALVELAKTLAGKVDGFNHALNAGGNATGQGADVGATGAETAH